MQQTTPYALSSSELRGVPLTVTEGLAAALLARSETGLMALDADNRVRFANRAALDLLGVSNCGDGEPMLTLIERADSLALSGAEVLATWLRNSTATATGLMLDNGRSVSVERAPGPEHHTMLSFKLEPRADVPASRRDALTGLADREWFFERLTRMLAEPAQEAAVLMIDLDRFKAVNDVLGHATGDAVLQVAAKRLTSALRDADVICRLSGDEFAVILQRSSDPRVVANRLISALSRPYRVEGTTATIGASIGVALAPEHGKDAASLTRSADIALYSVKHGPRGEMRIFDADLAQSARKRRALAEALRRAVPSRQLELHFQPLIALDSGRLTGFEALVRWNHPEFGLMLPEQFIPLAEETGIIWSISEWVMRTACEEASNWPLHVTVSVNISPTQLLDRHRLARAVKTVLLKTALAPKRLEIEVPEAVFEREAETLPVLTALRQMGVRVSIDDFGIGTSTLSQLRRFPLDKIKIDRSFIHALGTTDEASAIVRSTAALGRSLGIITTAEGVETETQHEIVRLDGCTEMQGFLLSKPVPASDVPALLAVLSPDAEVVALAG